MDILNREGKILVRLEAIENDREPHNLSFMDMDLGGAVFDGCSLVNAHFEGAVLHNVSFVRCNLYWAAFVDAQAEGADFRDANLRGADFSDANLKDACFDEADLSSDSLNGSTYLIGADMKGASLKATRFNGAVYDSRTTFPAGFAPEQHGMKLAAT